MPFIYRVFSKIISSDFEINFLTSSGLIGKERIDIEVSRNNQLSFDHITCNNKSSYSCNSSKSKIYLANIAYLEIINSGKLINYRELKDFKKFYTLFLSKFLNHIIPYSLYMSKELVLHASGISNLNNSVLFIGRPGSGKSSLSASFSEYSFISEDSILINFIESSCYATGSFPFIKLDDFIPQKIWKRKKEIVKVPGELSGRNLYKIPNFIKKKTRIKLCYILRWSDKFKITKFGLKESLRELHASSFGPNPLNSCPESQSFQYLQFTKFIKTVPIFLLERNKKDFFKNNDKIIKHANIL